MFYFVFFPNNQISFKQFEIIILLNIIKCSLSDFVQILKYKYNPIFILGQKLKLNTFTLPFKIQKQLPMQNKNKNKSKYNGQSRFYPKIIIQGIISYVKNQQNTQNKQMWNNNSLNLQNYPPLLKKLILEKKPSKQMIKFYTIPLYHGDSTKPGHKLKINKRTQQHRRNTYHRQFKQRQKCRYDEKTVNYQKYFIRQKILAKIQAQVFLQSPLLKKFPRPEHLQKFKQQLMKFINAIIQNDFKNVNKRGPYHQRRDFSSYWDQKQTEVKQNQIIIQKQRIQNQQINNPEVQQINSSKQKEIQSSAHLKITAEVPGYSISSNSIEIYPLKEEGRLVDQGLSDDNGLHEKKSSYFEELLRQLDSFNQQTVLNNCPSMANEPIQLQFSDYDQMSSMRDKDWRKRDEDQQPFI